MADETVESQEQAAPGNETPVAETRQAEQQAAEQTAEGADAAPEGAEQTADGGDDKKPVRIHSSIQARMDQLTKARREAERKAAALEIELAQLKGGQKPAAPGETQQPAGKTQQPDIDSVVNQKAEQLYRQRLHQERVNGVISAGNSEFKDFTERCNVVAQLGGADRPDFMEIVTDPMIVPDGHKVIAALADDPNEAARILSLPSVAMSAELARFAERAGKPAQTPKQLSKAPAPIRPINGAAKASDEPTSDDSDDEWFRKRAAQRANRHQVGRSL